MSKPTDHKRHRLIAELRAAGMTYREIGERFGITWQAVQQSLRLSGNPRTVPILCRNCKAVITQMRAVNHANALVYCMNCLPRGANFGERLKARRLAARLTLRALSRLSGLRLNRVGDYEQGTIQPTPATLAKLIRVLGVEWLDVGAESRSHRRKDNGAGRTEHGAIRRHGKRAGTGDRRGQSRPFASAHGADRDSRP
jgi:transcriptional regulator with XRE-family HTH domain